MTSHPTLTIMIIKELIIMLLIVIKYHDISQYQYYCSALTYNWNIGQSLVSFLRYLTGHDKYMYGNKKA